MASREAIAIAIGSVGTTATAEKIETGAAGTGTGIERIGIVVGATETTAEETETTAEATETIGNAGVETGMIAEAEIEKIETAGAEIEMIETAGAETETSVGEGIAIWVRGGAEGPMMSRHGVRNPRELEAERDSRIRGGRSEGGRNLRGRLQRRGDLLHLRRKNVRINC